MKKFVASDFSGTYLKTIERDRLTGKVVTNVALGNISGAYKQKMQKTLMNTVTVELNFVNFDKTYRKFVLNVGGMNLFVQISRFIYVFVFGSYANMTFKCDVNWIS